MMQVMPTTLRVLGASLVLFGVSACWGEKAAQTMTAATYAKPTNWTIKCVGRWTVDLPEPISFGFVNPEFRPDGGMVYLLPEFERLSVGVMALAKNRVYETSPFDFSKRYEYIRGRAEEAHERYLLGGSTKEEQLERKQFASQISVKWPTSFLWRLKAAYDFGIYSSEDKRARMIHGELSGAGSAAQAKAVVESLWPRYRIRTPGTIPTDAGICTPYGFFADPKGSTEQDYSFKMPLRSAQHNNLVLTLSVGTRPTPKPPEEGESPEPLAIENMPTPWEVEDKWAKRDKEKCRPQQGTASRDMFGCMFAGTKSITKHRDVEYLSLANGQKARLLVMEYSALGMLGGDTLYTVILETAGVPNSVTEPRIMIEASAQSKDSESKIFNGKNPPSIDETVALVRTLALSMRPRAGAVVDGAVVRDTLAGVR